MGIYDDHLLPRLINKTCGLDALRPLRRRACAQLTGSVVEVGFGSGLNVGEYPAAVRAVTAVEPSEVGWKLSAERVAASSIPVERSALDGQRLPFSDNTFDSALSTFTMCTIPDLDAALAEVRRVVKPGGRLCFLEHGTAPDESVRRWQRRLEPMQKKLAGGCHLTRDIAGELDSAGFTVAALDRFYQEGTPRPFGAMYLGSAVV